MPRMPLFTDQAPGGISVKQKDAGDLRQRLLSSVSVAPPETIAEFNFEGHWGETAFGDDRLNPPDDRPQVLINTKAFEAAGSSPAYFDMAVLMESLHNLKNVEPERYERIYAAAMGDEGYRYWAQEAALTEGIAPEDFEEWHRRSRFDQVIGGYLNAQNPDFPSMMNWRRDDLPWGEKLEAELKKLAIDLDMQ